MQLMISLIIENMLTLLELLSDCDFMLLWWQAAMDFVVEEDLKAHLTCWYIQKYVKENPQPQYFEHIYQWPDMVPKDKRRKKRLLGTEIRHHALELDADKQQRTFPGIVTHDTEWT